MSSKYGFETDEESRQKKEKEEQERKLREEEKLAEGRKRIESIANKIDGIVQDILNDLIRTKDWENLRYRVTKTQGAWSIVRPNLATFNDYDDCIRVQVSLPNEQPCLDVYFYVDWQKDENCPALCQALNQNTGLKVEMYNRFFVGSYYSERKHKPFQSWEAKKKLE